MTIAEEGNMYRTWTWTLILGQYHIFPNFFLQNLPTKGKYSMQQHKLKYATMQTEVCNNANWNMQQCKLKYATMQTEVCNNTNFKSTVCLSLQRNYGWIGFIIYWPLLCPHLSALSLNAFLVYISTWHMHLQLTSYNDLARAMLDAVINVQNLVNDMSGRQQTFSEQKIKCYYHFWLTVQTKKRSINLTVGKLVSKKSNVSKVYFVKTVHILLLKINITH